MSPRKWLVTDLDGVLSNLYADGVERDGILGAGLLDQYSAVIDFKGGLRLREPNVASDTSIEGDWIGSELLSEGARYVSKFASKYILSFKGGELVILRESFRVDYPFVTLHPDRFPAQIDLTTSHATVVRGVYQFVDGRLHLSIPALEGDDFFSRATGFEPALGAKYTTLVLEKVPAAPK